MNVLRNVNILEKSRMKTSIIALLLFPVVLNAQSDSIARARNQPVEPFRVLGNIYYVGASDVSSYLIATKAGHILIDGGYAETAPQILSNIQKLGFKPEEVKILLNSHAHEDHAGGLAAIKAATGAKLIVNPADAELLRSGGHGDFAFGDKLLFPPVKVDSLLKDKQLIRIGDMALQAQFTPGHTRGCTSYPMQTIEEKRLRNVVFHCSSSVPGYTLVNNTAYPEIVSDYRASFKRLRGLPCHVYLGMHGSQFGLDEKRAQLKSSSENPFVSAAQCKAIFERASKAFEDELTRQGGH